MADIAGLERLIEPEIKSLGFDLVRVMMIGGTTDPTLQVMAERPDTRQLGIADCEAISHRLSELLDRGLDMARPGVAVEGNDEVAYRTERIERRICRAVAEFAFREAEKSGAKVFGGPKYTVSPVY